MRATEDLAAADRRHLWHPFTQQQGWSEDEPPLVIDHAEGTNLYDTDGHAYIDGVSSLWCNVHGHRHPAIDAAVRDQLGRVAHSTMLGLSHEPAITLAEQLVAIAPPGLTRVFYSDSGSTAVEVALKMAFQWWAQQGQHSAPASSALRTPITATRSARCRSAASICSTRCTGRSCSIPGAHAPATRSISHRSSSSTEHRVAAVIIEPLVQGAAGMLMQPDGYVRRVRELCDEHGVLLICDEVATGFGRTGRMFACEHEDVTPDLLCVGKGLTGGYLPLAATLATERIYEGFLGRVRSVPHVLPRPHVHRQPARVRRGDRDARDIRARAHDRAARPQDRAAGEDARPQVAILPGVADVRQRGFMVGIELSASPARERMGHRVTLAARRRRCGDPPARRRCRADARPRDLRVRPPEARGDHSGSDQQDNGRAPPRGGLASVHRQDNPGPRGGESGCGERRPHVSMQRFDEYLGAKRRDSPQRARKRQRERQRACPLDPDREPAFLPDEDISGQPHGVGPD